MKAVPIWVKAIAVYYLGMAIYAVHAILLILWTLFMSALTPNMHMGLVVPNAASQYTNSHFFIIGLFAAGIFVGVFFSSLGIGLWNGKKWARIISILLAGLGVLIAIWTLTSGGILSGGITFVLNSIVGAYLLLNKDVKAAFK